MIVIKEIAVKLQLPELTDEAVEAVHRLRAKEGKTPPLLVRFTERKMRDIWIQKRVALRNEHIYINENVTRRNRNLLWQAKNRAKDEAYTFVWSRNGKLVFTLRSKVT